MTENSFTLVAFPDASIPDISITGQIARQDHKLAVRFILRGDISGIHMPETSRRPDRKDELWLATCFEFFIALPGQPQYWEFNMSPSGDWNIYHIDAYRRIGFREETLIQRLPFSVQKEAGCVSVEAAVDLSPIIQVEDFIQVGITSIIQTRDGRETYWALNHPNSQADFHVRESFSIEL